MVNKLSHEFEYLISREINVSECSSESGFGWKHWKQILAENKSTQLRTKIGSTRATSEEQVFFVLLT